MENTEQKIVLKNVRLSFPSLFQPEVYGGEPTGKYAATFILDKEVHAKEISIIKKATNDLMMATFKGKIPSDKLALKDGDESGRPEYAGAYTIKASTKKRPTVIDRDKSPLVEEDGKPYSGCYVNAIISLWAQNNAYGKRINGNLLGVQFYKDGEAFGSGPIDVSGDFEEYDDAADF